MPKPKLTYFPVTGRAEPIKYMLALANVDYENDVANMEGWPDLKPKTLMGQLPEYTDDGVTFSQTPAIARYVAEKYGFTPSKLIEKAQCDMYVAHILQDVFGKFVKAFFPYVMHKDDVAKQEWETFNKDSKDGFLDVYEKALCKSEFLVGGKRTWADLVAAELFSRFYYFDKTALDGHPKVKAWVDRINGDPAIKKHIAERGYDR